jgi:ubiquinone/menaquinone biosynthesis C-methylase UbiE
MEAFKRLFGDKREPQAAPDQDELQRKARISGDPFDRAPYYDLAEPEMDQQWETMLWPMIKDLDFTSVVDLAAGHGRNTAKILQQARAGNYPTRVMIVDILRDNIDFCKKRFNGVEQVSYLCNDGYSLKEIRNLSVTLVYTFDSMVHFDSDVIRAYMKEFYRILKPGGHCFCHHSNYTGNPGGDFTTNPHWRNFMSKELFAHYAIKEGFKIIEQKVIDWSIPNLDCLSLIQKP